MQSSNTTDEEEDLMKELFGIEDDEDEVNEEEDEPVPELNCASCFVNLTKRRCSVCNVCALCSPECEQSYSRRCNGGAACAFHNLHARNDGNGLVMNTETALMSPLITGIAASEALTHALKVFVATLSLNPELPLHENSVVGLSFVPIAQQSFSVAMKRSLDINWSADTESDALLKVMVLRLSQLATSQMTNGRALPNGTKLGSQVFLLGKPVKHSTTKNYVLQIDIVQITNATLSSTEDLRSVCAGEDVSIRPFFCQALDVVQNQTFFGFDATPRLRPVSIEGVRPLLSASALLTALPVMSTPPSA
jgi:hypothetical protein